MREQNRLPRYKNKPALVRSYSSPSPVNQLIAPSSTPSPPTSSTTFTVKYNPAPLKRSSSNTFTPTDSPAPSQTIPYKAPLVATSSLPSTPRSIGFSFRPFYVKTTYFCEHDDPEDDKVTTYITWVNNQLARGNGTTPITNLERGISDGTTLPQLLHILGDEAVADAVIPPKSESQRKQNIRLCFQYLQQRHIHPRNTTASDVSSGNVKCIMRLLLALAANFKTYRPDTRSVRYMASISEGGACNGSPHSPAPTDPCDLGDEEEMSWMYDQVIDTKKQLESLKHLLLKDITDDERVMLDEAGVEVSLPACTMCEDTTEKVKNLEEMLKSRDQQVLELKAEVLHLKTRDKYLTSELDERNMQITKLKSLLERKQAVSESKGRMEKKASWNSNNANTKLSSSPAAPGKPHGGGGGGGTYTKILYYLGNSTTPYLSTCGKSLGDITLSDFKSVVNRTGRFRYNFRSFDRDVGPVKQELSEDSAILPGWEGRIVGFVEELPPGNSLDHIEI